MSVKITTTNVWPATLPLPALEYSGGAAVATIVSVGSAAKIRRRSRWATSYAALTVRWLFTAAQLTEFLTFWSDTLGNGAARFEIELRFPKNTALDEWIVGFISDIEINALDDNMNEVNTNLQLISKTTLPDAAALI